MSALDRVQVPKKPGFAFLNGKTQALEDDIHEASVQVLNLVVANRQKVSLQGLEQAA